MAQEQIDTKAGFFVQDDEEVCDDNSPQSMRLSAYAFFVQSAREEHMKKNPNDKLIFCEFSKQCVEKWNVGFSFF